MKTISLVLAAVIASGTVLALEDRASACSAPLCYGATAYLLPQTGTTVPANAAGITVFSGVGNGEEAPIALVKTVAGAPEVVPFSVVDAGPQRQILAPTGGLEEGATYEVTVGSTCRSGGQAATSSFTVGASQPKPTALGSLRLRNLGVQSLEVGSGASCSERISAAQAEIEISLAPASAAWGPLFRYETYVDGKRWTASSDATMQVHRAGSWRGIGKDLVYAACGKVSGGAVGLTPGRHRVLLRGYLAGDGDRSFDSNTVDVDLSCGAVPIAPAPTGSTTSGPVGVGNDLPGIEPYPETGEVSSSSGCSAAPGAPGDGTSSVLGFGLGLGLVAAAITKRRTRA